MELKFKVKIRSLKNKILNYLIKNIYNLLIFLLDLKSNVLIKKKKIY